jgi:hypothetical protein
MHEYEEEISCNIRSGLGREVQTGDYCLFFDRWNLVSVLENIAGCKIWVCTTSLIERKVRCYDWHGRGKDVYDRYERSLVCYLTEKLGNTICLRRQPRQHLPSHVSVSYSMLGDDDCVIPPTLRKASRLSKIASYPKKLELPHRAEIVWPLPRQCRQPVLCLFLHDVLHHVLRDALPVVVVDVITPYVTSELQPPALYLFSYVIKSSFG